MVCNLAQHTKRRHRKGMLEDIRLKQLTLHQSVHYTKHDQLVGFFGLILGVKN